MNREAKMAGEVQKLRIELDLRPATQDHTAKVVIAMAMGHAANLTESPQMSVQEKLEALTGIKPGHRITGPGQDVDEAIDRARRQSPFCPICLALFPGKKFQLVEGDGPFLTKTLGAALDRPIAAFIAVGLKFPINLGRPQKGIIPVPFRDQPLVGQKNRGRRRFFDLLFPDDAADGLARYLEFRGNLPQA